MPYFLLAYFTEQNLCNISTELPTIVKFKLFSFFSFEGIVSQNPDALMKKPMAKSENLFT
jgi:hypothetical protein